MESDSEFKQKIQVSDSNSLYIFCVSNQTFSSDEKQNILNQIHSSKKIKNIIRFIIKINLNLTYLRFLKYWLSFEFSLFIKDKY